MTGVQVELLFCSPGSSSGKQKEARSTSQQQFCSENFIATIEIDQISLVLQQMASINKFANFNNSIDRISKLPKSFTTTTLIFNVKQENFELFEDLFQTSLKVQNNLTEEVRIHYLDSVMLGDDLQTFKNMSSPSKKSLAEVLTVFRKKYIKPQSMVTAKHKLQRLVFNPANQKLICFLDQLRKTAKNAFEVAVQAIVEVFMFRKTPQHLKKSIIEAHSEKNIYEQILSHVEKELVLSDLEAAGEMQLNPVATKHKTKTWETQPDMSSQQKTGALPKQVPSSQERERPKWYQQK